MSAGNIHRIAERATERLVEYVADKCRFAASAHTAHNRHHAKRELHVYVLEIVLGSSRHFDEAFPGTALPRQFYAAVTAQVIHCVGSVGAATFQHFPQISIQHHFAP